jgi:molybdopterin-guanine dinucleotide biosynthesis protein A
LPGENDPPQDSAEAFILAGGQSSRMGRDKALALLNGRTLIQIALDTLSRASIASRIAGARSDLSSYAETVPDTTRNQGPLAGIQAALAVSHSHWNLFIPVDLPLMPASLLVCLLERARLTGSSVTATTLNGRVEPFPVILHRSILPQLALLLEAGQSACYRAWQTIPTSVGSTLDAPAVESLQQAGLCCHPSGLPPAFWYRSANTPAELSWLNEMQLSLESRLL